ncbi:AbgT family transporter [Kocuria rhizophila]|nr:AbgT family transporter [Kocuria rhizophila]
MTTAERCPRPWPRAWLASLPCSCCSSPPRSSPRTSSESGIGPVLAVHGADFIGSLGLSPVFTFAGIVVIVAVMNLLITSGSAQWTLLAPVVVPHAHAAERVPEMTRRCSASATPRRRDQPRDPVLRPGARLPAPLPEQAGVGTLICLVLPVSIAMLIGWFLLFVAWYLLACRWAPRTSDTGLDQSPGPATARSGDRQVSWSDDSRRRPCDADGGAVVTSRGSGGVSVAGLHGELVPGHHHGAGGGDARGGVLVGPVGGLVVVVLLVVLVVQTRLTGLGGGEDLAVDGERTPYVGYFLMLHTGGCGSPSRPRRWSIRRGSPRARTRRSWRTCPAARSAAW